MDNKVEALLAISDKANEHFKYLLFYTPQDEKLMFQRLRDVLEMTSELTERIERISDDFINKKTFNTTIRKGIRKKYFNSRFKNGRKENE